MTDAPHRAPVAPGARLPPAVRAAIRDIAPHLHLLVALQPQLAHAAHVLQQAATGGAGRFGVADDDLLLEMARMERREPGVPAKALARRVVLANAKAAPAVPGQEPQVLRRAIPGDGNPAAACVQALLDTEVRRLVRKWKQGAQTFRERAMAIDMAAKSAGDRINRVVTGEPAPALVLLRPGTRRWRPRPLASDPDLGRKVDGVLRAPRLRSKRGHNPPD